MLLCSDTEACVGVRVTPPQDVFRLRFDVKMMLLLLARGMLCVTIGDEKLVVFVVVAVGVVGGVVCSRKWSRVTCCLSSCRVYRRLRQIRQFS